MDYQEKIPSHPLFAVYIEKYWTIKAPAPHNRTIQGIDLPDGTVEYVVNANTPYTRQVITQPETKSMNRNSLIYAQKRKSSLIEIAGTSDLFCIRFKPFGLFGLTGESLFEMINFSIDPVLIFGPLSKKLEENIILESSFDKRVDATEEILSNFIQRSRQIDPHVISALELIHASNGTLRISKIAALLSRSRRFLELKFKEQTGITMKEYARIRRFNYFLKLKKSKMNKRTAPLALDCGYYDQSHLIKEFHFFTGMSTISFSNSDFNFLKLAVPEDNQKDRATKQGNSRASLFYNIF